LGLASYGAMADLVNSARLAAPSELVNAAIGSYDPREEIPTKKQWRSI